MSVVYMGYGIDRARAQRLNNRAAKRKKRVKTVTLVKYLALVILFTLACTYCIIGLARGLEEKNRHAQSRSYQISVSNRINAVQFEIRRELLPENLTLKAQTQLGMIRPRESASLNASTSLQNAAK